MQKNSSSTIIPDDWAIISDVMELYKNKIDNAIKASHIGKKKVESLWEVSKLNAERSRYIYDMYYNNKIISKELYNYCIDNHLIDATLIAKWKKKGYEKLCCVRCIDTTLTNFNSVCVCRVPKVSAKDIKVRCNHCGCEGCSY